MKFRWKTLAAIIVAILTTIGAMKYLPPEVPLWLMNGAAVLDERAE